MHRISLRTFLVTVPVDFWIFWIWPWKVSIARCSTNGAHHRTILAFAGGKSSKVCHKHRAAGKILSCSSGLLCSSWGLGQITRVTGTSETVEWAFGIPSYFVVAVWPFVFRVFPDSHVIAARLGIAQIKVSIQPGFQSATDEILEAGLHLVFQKPNDLDKGFGNLAFASSVAKNLDDDILLAVGSVMQRKLDSDGALKKFEVILQEPGEMNAAVLNNVGLSYFARRKLTSAKTGNRNVADGDYSRRILQSLGCLRKAQQLAPFDWRIAANLGYVARGMHLYATASYHLMAAIKLSRREPIISPYLLLAGAHRWEHYHRSEDLVWRANGFFVDSLPHPLFTANSLQWSTLHHYLGSYTENCGSFLLR